MEHLKIIACDPIVGQPRVPLDGINPTFDDLLAEMARLGLDAVIVRHRAALDNAPCFANQSLAEDLAGLGGRGAPLIPAWVLTPDGWEPDFDVQTAVDGMLSQGIRMAWMIPKEHLFSVKPWCSGRLYQALQAARVPLMVENDQLTADDVHEICAVFPRLRLILLNLPRLGRNRLIYPLLEQHPNLCLCFGPSLSVHGGFADLCRAFGPHRWVFGSGYPAAEGGAALAGLLYAGLDDQAVRAIAHENIERWLADVTPGDCT